MSDRENIHATGLVLGKTGIILRGPSGSGKSIVALSLMEQFETRGLNARLVADDRIEIESVSGGLVMHAPPQIAGLIELRGRGIVRRPHVNKAPIHLVVDFVPVLERMVEEEDLSTRIAGVTLPRCPVPKVGIAELGHQLLLVGEALRALGGKVAAPRQKTT